MAMAFRVTASIGPPANSISDTNSSTNLNSKYSNVKGQQPRLPIITYPHSLLSSSTAAISFIALFSNPSAALAFSKEDILSSFTKVEDTIDLVGDAASKTLGLSQQVIKVVYDTLKPAADVALPALQSTAQEALKITSPLFSKASQQALEALQGAGVDTAPFTSAASTVARQTPKIIEGAKPIASATVETIASSDPSVVVVSAGALFLAYLLFPPFWSLLSFNFRGYKGSLSPAQALDLVSAQNYFLIDIRSEKDKNKAGIPRLPSNAKNKISVPLEELPSKIKGIVKNTKKVEAEIAALKISYLKKINKGSNIVILDSYGDVAKTVAKTLTSLGFKNCYVVSDGFSGGRGWLQSRLGTDSYNMSAEVLSPSRIIPAAARFGTTGSTAFSSRKLLPGVCFALVLLVVNLLSIHMVNNRIRQSEGAS